MKRPLYTRIASHLDAMRRCMEVRNDEWWRRHGDILDKLCRNFLPSGSGIDTGTTLVKVDCTTDRLVFSTSFHHMNDAGMYDGWTDHSVIVKPSFDGIDIKITGRNRNDIKDYLHDVFRDALTQEIDDAEVVMEKCVNW